jgi:hypothetical protein
MTSTPPEQPRLTVRSPADLLAAVPYLLGFHPTDSLVTVALRDKKVIFAARGDLPAQAVPRAEVTAVAEQVASVVSQQGGSAATLVGYGAADRVDRIVPVVRDALAAHGVRLLEAMRVADGRYWSYLCADPGCCPPDGTPYDPATSQVAVAATYAGHVALPDREAVVRQVAPIGGLTRESMRQATLRAEERLVDLLDTAGVADLLGGKAIRQSGEAAVDTAFARYAEGGRLSDDETAWLSLLLGYLPVRDLAWARITDDDWQVELWADVVRRAEPDLVPPVASLLAYAAWLAGRGALANVALDRALAEDPAYSMALLLREALDRGLSPEALASWPPAGASGGGVGGVGRRGGRRGARRGAAGMDDKRDRRRRAARR